MKIIIVGGVACGPKAAARLHRLRPHADITIIEKGELLSYAGCGMPYYISGEVHNINELMKTNLGIVRDSHYFRNFKGLNVRNLTLATRIDRQKKQLEILDLQSITREMIPYDKLILATGGQPIMPPIPGIDLKGVHSLHDLHSARKIKDAIRDGAKKAVIIGGGAIGIEVADAFIKNDVETTIIEAKNRLFAKVLDPDMSATVQDYLAVDDIILQLSTRVIGFEGNEEGGLKKVITDRGIVDADLVINAIGVHPNTLLAEDAGLELGVTGAIRVNAHMQTTDPDIYAGGDCVESIHLITRQPVYIPMGDTANKHGRVIANHIAEFYPSNSFPGVLGTAIYKYGDLSIGHSGVTHTMATSLGYDCESILYPGLDKPEFFPTARRIDMKLVADRKNHRIIGVQIVGEGEVSKRLDVLATAMTFGATVEQLAHLDLGYAPPYSPAIDNAINAANICCNKLNDVSRSVTPAQVWQMRQNGSKLLLVDVRTQREYQSQRIDLEDVVHIPLNLLRQRMAELPRDRPVITFCKVGLRGYEACQLLRGLGLDNACFMEGGVALWPYPKITGQPEQPNLSTQ
ncbi:MAG: FAD-dependent oxidoreductase [Magnetococcales bacterium]|nr:FAD-dependent oxidoreductase [Magnetococcales bacterium]